MESDAGDAGDSRADGVSRCVADDEVQGVGPCCSITRREQNQRRRLYHIIGFTAVGRRMEEEVESVKVKLI